MGKGRKQRKKSLGEKWKKRRPYRRTGQEAAAGRFRKRTLRPAGIRRQPVPGETPGSAGKKTGGGVDVVKLSLIGLGAVAAAAYIIVAFYFGGHFYSGATIYGIDCSRMTADR